MTVSTDALAAVPTGPENAATSRAIWQRMGCWSEISVGNQLVVLAEEGAIKRRRGPIPSGFVWLYWKEPEGGE